MKYQQEVFLSVVEGTRQIKRVINLPKECQLERGRYHLILLSDGVDSTPTPENLQAKETKETTRKLIEFLNEVKDTFANSESKWDKWVELFGKHLTDEDLGKLEESLHE